MQNSLDAASSHAAPESAIERDPEPTPIRSPARRSDVVPLDRVFWTERVRRYDWPG
jgi:hypothetical protein